MGKPVYDNQGNLLRIEPTDEVQKLAPAAKLEFFHLDFTNIPGGGHLYFHCGTNNLQAPVIWQGQTYMALPVEAEGFDLTTQGALPRPKLRVANLNGVFSAEVMLYDDLVGAKLTRKRTFAKYLDAANFPGGNADANPTVHYEDDLWYINQKVSENRYLIEFELASAFDLAGVQLPYRQVNQNSCPWTYRGAECGYNGSAYFDNKDQAETDPAKDVCGKALSSCKARFGNNVLPFGGFPGARRYEDQFSG